MLRVTLLDVNAHTYTATSTITTAEHKRDSQCMSDDLPVPCLHPERADHCCASVAYDVRICKKWCLSYLYSYETPCVNTGVVNLCDVYKQYTNGTIAAATALTTGWAA
jgi:hypothetical protein